LGAGEREKSLRTKEAINAKDEDEDGAKKKFPSCELLVKRFMNGEKSLLSSSERRII
jgi:hypothetical protein